MALTPKEPTDFYYSISASQQPQPAKKLKTRNTEKANSTFSQKNLHLPQKQFLLSLGNLLAAARYNGFSVRKMTRAKARDALTKSMIPRKFYSFVGVRLLAGVRSKNQQDYSPLSPFEYRQMLFQLLPHQCLKM